MPLLEVKQVSKYIFGQSVISDISFDLPEGKVAGLFGINGSGKSTLLKAIAGLVQLDKGFIKVNSDIPNTIGEKVAYLGHKNGFLSWMKLSDIEKVMRLHYKSFCSKKYKEYLSLLEVPNRPLSTMSKGQVARLKICAQFSLSSPLMLLDEPLSGIDPVSKSLIVDLISQKKSKNHTIIVSTHELECVKDILDLGIFMKKGDIIGFDSIERILSASSSLSDYFLKLERKDNND